jgi:hypothetical protein
MGISDELKLHVRYLAVLEQLASKAKIDPRFIRTSMEDFCGQPEINWVKNFRQLRSQGMPGLILVGLSDPETRCQALAGALIRDLIDPQVIPISDLAQNPSLGEVPDVLVLNFVAATHADPEVSSAAVAEIGAILEKRAACLKPSVLYVQNMGSLKLNEGSSLSALLSQYLTVNAT